MYICVKDSIIGKISIIEDNNKIIALSFGDKSSNSSFELKETPVLKEAFKQLDEFLLGKRKSFDLPLFFETTDFQAKVLNELLKIPYGKTASYKNIAIKIDNPKGVRAVGMANNKNPLPIFIPCHRVIGSDGSLTGYAGGLDIKTKLLEIESKNI